MRLLYDRAPTLHRFIVLTAANEPQARRALLRFGQSVLRSELRDKPFLVILPDLEARAVDYIGAFTSAAGKAGADADTIVSLVLLEHVAISGSGAGSSTVTAGGSSDSSLDLSSDPLTADMYGKCFREARFRAFTSAILVASTDTCAGRRQIILEGFGSGTSLCAKLLLSGSVSLAKKHTSLGRLYDARGELPDYFGWVTVIDPVSKTVPPLLVEWKWSGPDGTDTAMMKQFCALKFSAIDWFNGANGINALVAWKRSQKTLIAYTDPMDFYSTVQSVESLSEFCHPLFRGIGAADVLASPSLGFTMASWCLFYIAHIKMALGLASLKEQIAWLEDASVQFVCWWVLVAETIHRFVNSSEADRATFTYLTTADCAPAEHLREKQKSKSLLDQGRQLFDWMGRDGAGFSRAPDPHSLPLLSAHKQMLKFFSPKVDTPAAFKPKGKDTNTKTKIPGGGAVGAATPGSAVHFWVWLTATTLLLGKSVYDVGLICSDFAVDIASVCWPFALSLKKGESRLSLCNKHGSHADHKTLDSGAHRPIPGLDLSSADQRKKYMRSATDAELAKLPAPPTGKGTGAGGGRGGGGRGGSRGVSKRDRGRGRSQSFRRPA